MNQMIHSINQLMNPHETPSYTIDEAHVETCKTALNESETQWNYTSPVLNALNTSTSLCANHHYLWLCGEHKELCHVPMGYVSEQSIEALNTTSGDALNG